MASVFGVAITDPFLREMPEYRDRQIGKRDRVQVAMLFKNAGTKRDQANAYVEALRRQWGDGVSTLGLIYNATGDTIKFTSTKDWSGNIGPAPYPSEIANGQWGGFLHVKTSGSISGSNSAVVYRCNNGTAESDWMVAWDNPWDRMSYDSKVLTQIQQVNYFDGAWDIINTQMAQLNDHPNDQNTANGCKSTVAMSECSFSSQGCKLLCAEISLAPAGP
ncbi:hypothetical protein SLE2022_132790 [Rubroshorea leprosula]